VSEPASRRLAGPGRPLRAPASEAPSPRSPVSEAAPLDRLSPNTTSRSLLCPTSECPSRRSEAFTLEPMRSELDARMYTHLRVAERGGSLEHGLRSSGGLKSGASVTTLLHHRVKGYVPDYRSSHPPPSWFSLNGLQSTKRRRASARDVQLDEGGASRFSCYDWCGHWRYSSVRWTTGSMLRLRSGGAAKPKFWRSCCDSPGGSSQDP